MDASSFRSGRPGGTQQGRHAAAMRAVATITVATGYYC